MKKYLAIVTFCIMLISTFTLAGCAKDNILDTNVYLKPTVSAKIYSVGTTQNLTTTQITSKNPGEQKKYLSFEIKLNKDWIYGMNIEQITYYIYSNKDMVDVEFDLTLTGTEHGEATITNSTKTFKLTQQPYTLTKNKGFKVVVNVNDKITLSTSDSVLTIKLSDTFTDPGFEYTIYGLEITGQH